MADGLARRARRFPGSRVQGQSPGQACCKRGRMRTAGPVRRRDVVARDGDLDMSLAIEEVVKITESILADYRLQARNEATLGQIFEILEIFSETGWPQALRLVWRLDEVYR